MFLKELSFSEYEFTNEFITSQYFKPDWLYFISRFQRYCLFRNFVFVHTCNKLEMLQSEVPRTPVLAIDMQNIDPTSYQITVTRQS